MFSKLKRKFWLHLELVHCTLKLNLNTEVGRTINTGYILGIYNVKHRRIIRPPADHIYRAER